MKRLSAGVLHSAHILGEMLLGGPILCKDFPELFPSFLVAKPDDVLETALTCFWMRVDSSGNLSITSRGIEITQTLEMQDRMRLQIEDFVRIERPPWIHLAPKGRKEMLPFLPGDVRQCLCEAGLTEGHIDEGVVEWWDRLAALSRGMKSDQLLKLGRIGERRVFEYEKKRTGRDPVWQSIESNLCGYDILSVISELDATPLMIEVKTSLAEKISNSAFYISRNEWEVAVESSNFKFYLWLLESQKCSQSLFASVSTSEITPHIPINAGTGKWETATVPFASMISHFVEI